MKLTLMLMGGSALLLVGLLGIYFNSAREGGNLTFNILEIAKVHIPIEAQRFFFPIDFYRIRCAWCTFPFPYLVARWSCFRSYRCFDASCRCINETGRLRCFQGCYVSVA